MDKYAHLRPGVNSSARRQHYSQSGHPKRVYPTEEAAEAAVENIRIWNIKEGRGDEIACWYQCEVCHFFHVGHVPVAPG